MPDDAADAALLDNQLAFLAAHRGAVRRSRDAIEVVGDSPDFSVWIPLSTATELPADARTVRLVPWSGDGWEERLLRAGFEPTHVLVHMEAPVEGAADEPLVAVASDAEAADFAEVQAAAFLDPEEADYDWWRKEFVERAVQNYREQALYLLRVDGHPAATTLVLRTGPVTGVYAVATKPQYRGRGLATRLLGQARRDAAGGRLTLQVVEGSDAERLYLSLGFRCAFRSPHFRRP
ncbi:GNAT family N-acetyltransferase [Kribbella sp. NPDC026611]|uniref:GNAT family N-acetyltransferase n=1 Tax=Kribbella sp. NPDC026611 TaxID=3154911 RepID=UPI0033E0A132